MEVVQARQVLHRWVREAAHHERLHGLEGIRACESAGCRRGEEGLAALAPRSQSKGQARQPALKVVDKVGLNELR